MKHHQYISQAVDCQKTKGRKEKHEYCFYQVSLKEVKKVVAKPIKVEKEKTVKPSNPCFFCRKLCHFKKNCKRYKAWLQKKRVQTAELKQVRTEDMDLAPQSFVKARECSDQTRATVTVSNLTP